MRNSRMALAVASAVPLALCGAVPAFAQTADSVNAPVMELGVATLRGAQPVHSINATDSQYALECITRPMVRKRYVEHPNNDQFWRFLTCPQRTCMAVLKRAL